MPPLVPIATIDAWIAARGPYLFHLSDGAHENGNLASILEHGLLPWDDPRVPGSLYDGDFYQPQPGCVYLAATAQAAFNLRCWQCREHDNGCCALLRVDLRRLDLTRLRLDEDIIEYSQLAVRLGLRAPRDTAFFAGAGPSLGEWAAAQPVLADPRLALLSLQSWTGRPGVPVSDTGSCAYRGSVPAAAVEAFDMTPLAQVA